MGSFLKNNKLLVIVASLVLIILIVLVVVGKEAQNNVVDNPNPGEVQATPVDPGVGNTEYAPGVDTWLLAAQPDLEKKNGTPPEGFLWDYAGNLLPLGVKDMSPEDVLFTYMKSLSILDFSAVGRFSKDSRVFSTYDKYFNSELQDINNYKNNFERSMYREALLSLEVLSIVNSSTFANDKVSYEIKIRVLDNTNKDFWLDDKESIFENIEYLKTVEKDGTKANNYIFDYILDVYKNKGKYMKRDVNISITLEKIVKIDSGWLVTLDSELDKVLKYENGTEISEYIMNEYDKWKLDKDLAEINGTGTEEVTPEPEVNEETKEDESVNESNEG